MWSMDFYGQLDFSYEPGVQILENEPKSCLVIYSTIYQKSAALNLKEKAGQALKAKGVALSLAKISG